MPAFDFKVENQISKDHNVFITNDPNLNKLTFYITNSSGETINLTGGNSVENGQGGPSSFYLYLDTILSNGEVHNIQIQKDGWNITHYDSKLDGSCLALCPSQNTSLIPNDTISFELTHIIATGVAISGHLRIDFTNINGISDDSDEIKLDRSNPINPQKRDIKLLGHFISESKVYITKNPDVPIYNNLVFSISNPDQNTPLVPPNAKQGPNKPRLIISFVGGKGPGALASNQNIDQLELSIFQTYKDLWEQPKKGDDPKNPQWTVYPKTQEILGVKEHASVSFTINNLITEVDYPDSTTLMYIRYVDFPNCNDGYTTLPITKKLPTPGILSFSASKTEIKLGGQVELSWNTFAVSRVVLSYKEDSIGKVLDSAKGDIPLNPGKLTLSPKKDLTYTLTAYDNNGNKIDHNEQESVSVIQPPPQIIKFTASPNDVCTSPLTSTIEWEVAYADYVIIDALGTGQQTIKGSTQHVFNEPQTITLTAVKNGVNKRPVAKTKIIRLPKIVSCNSNGTMGISWEISCATKVSITGVPGFNGTTPSGNYVPSNITNRDMIIAQTWIGVLYNIHAESPDGSLNKLFLSVDSSSPFGIGSRMFDSRADFDRFIGVPKRNDGHVDIDISDNPPP